MEKLNVYLIRFHNNGYFCKTVILAESYKDAERMLTLEYGLYGIKIDIEEYEEISNKGIILTESTKL